jgi:hypothetical protein
MAEPERHRPDSSGAAALAVTILEYLSLNQDPSVESGAGDRITEEATQSEHAKLIPRCEAATSERLQLPEAELEVSPTEQTSDTNEVEPFERRGIS